jgi:lysophospholipase L1-like esterase
MDDGTPQGVLALGDSITNGGGELQWGVALQSWAQWLARGLGLPFTNHAIDGATVADVLTVQIPRHERGSARPEARFDVGCLYIGVNDVRGAGWDADAYSAGFDRALGWLGDRCDRRLVCTLPLDLGRPRATGVPVANGTVRAAAARHGALVVELSDFGARNHVMVDHVHPSAFGQIAIAERALRVLAADGLATRVAPSSLISYETTRWGRLRGDWTYAYRHAKVSARAAWRHRRLHRAS